MFVTRMFFVNYSIEIAELKQAPIIFLFLIYILALRKLSPLELGLIVHRFCVHSHVLRCFLMSGGLSLIHIAFFDKRYAKHCKT
jgi:hypothetical protein